VSVGARYVVAAVGVHLTCLSIQSAGGAAVSLGVGCGRVGRRTVCGRAIRRAAVGQHDLLATNTLRGPRLEDAWDTSAAVGVRGAGCTEWHTRIAADERRAVRVAVGHTGQSAAVGAGGALVSGEVARVGAIAHPRAARNAQQILLARRGDQVHVPSAAVVFRVARRSRELADGAGRAASVAVVAPAHRLARGLAAVH